MTTEKVYARDVRTHRYRETLQRVRRTSYLVPPDPLLPLLGRHGTRDFTKHTAQLPYRQGAKFVRSLCRRLATGAARAKQRNLNQNVSYTN